MQRLRSGKIHPILICILALGVIAGIYVRYVDWAGKEAAKQALENAETRPARNPMDATEFIKSNPRPERTTPFKYLFSDNDSTLSVSPSSNVSVVYAPEAMTASDYHDGSQKYWLQSVEHFRSANQAKPKAVVDETAQVLEEIIAALHVGPVSNLQPFRERLTPLLIDPNVARDPLFLYFAGLVLLETGETKAADQLFYGSIIDHAKQDYPSRFVVPVFNARIELGSERSAETNVHERLADAIVGWLQYDFSESADQHRFCWAILQGAVENFSNDSKLDYAKKIIDKNDKDNFMAPWLAEMLSGEYFFQLAKSGESRLENLANSKKHFLAAHEINPVFSESIAGLIHVASASGSEEKPAEWLEKAEQLQIGDYLVFQAMLDAFESTEDRLKFGLDCYNKKQFDSIVPYALVDAHQRCQAEVNLPETLTAVVECLGQLANDPTPKYLGARLISPDWLRSAQAVIAIKNHQHDVAANAFENLGDRFDPRVIETFPGISNLSRARAISVASVDTSSDLQPIDRLEELVQSQRMGKDVGGLIRKNLGEYSPMRTKLPYFESVAVFRQAVEAYLAGDWVKLGFDNGLLNWESSTESQLDADSAASITLSTLSGENRAFVMSNFYTPGSKTIELDVEFLVSRDPYDAEIIFGDWREYGTTAVISIDPVRQRLGFGSMVFGGNIAKFQYNEDESQAREFQRFNLRINVADGYAEVFANGHFVLRSTSSRILPSSMIGFGVNGYGKARGQVRFSKIRVKKWDAVPPLGDALEMVEHYSNLTEVDPTDSYAWFFRGLAELENQKLADAQLYLQKSLQLGLPRLQAAPYLGDIADRIGDHETANQLYQFVYESLPVKPFEVLQKEDKVQSHDRFQVAAARYLWNELTDPDLDHEARNALIQGLDAIDEGNSPVGSDSAWINERFKAQVSAIKAQALAEEAAALKEISDTAAAAVAAIAAEEEGHSKSQAELEQEKDAVQAAKRFEKATKGAEQELERAKQAIGVAIAQATIDTVGELEKQREAIEQQVPYSRDPNSPAQSAGPNELRYFPTLKDWLRPDWQKIYE